MLSWDRLADAFWGWWDPQVAMHVDERYLRYLVGPSARGLWLWALVGVACLVVKLIYRPKRNAQARDGKPAERPMRVRHQPWYRRLRLWWVHRLDQPYYWKVGKHVANLNQTHGMAVGGSGSGKSTIVIDLILQPVINLKMWLMRRLGVWRRRPVLIVSFDRSDPIEEATNVLEDSGVHVERWRVRQSNGWDLLDGDAEMIAEALPEGWPHGDNTGFFQQLATDAVSAALHEQEDEGVPRDFLDMIDRMDRIMSDDPETPELARRTWVRRFRSLARVMGESIGQDFNLVGALKPGAVVHLSSNSYTNPALTPLVGAMAIAHVKLAAETVKGGAYLVLEEASFLKKRSDLLDDLARSLRARGWRIVYLNQDPCAVGDALTVNFGVAVFMGLGPLAVKARQWCADVVKGFPGAFRAEELVLGATIDQLEGYVLLNGRCRDVSLPPYITRAAESRVAKRRSRYEWAETGAAGQGVPCVGVPLVPRARGGERNDFDGTASRDWFSGTGELGSDEWSNELVALPAGTRPTPPEYFVRHPQLLALWPMLTGTWDANACWLIQKEKTNSDNRAKVWMPAGTRREDGTVRAKGEYSTGYVETCRALRGERPKPVKGSDGKLKDFEVDHSCHNEDLHCVGGKLCIHRRCLNAEHQQWVSPQVNSVRMQVRKQRRLLLLSGAQTSWALSVADEADRWIRERNAVAV